MFLQGDVPFKRKGRDEKEREGGKKKGSSRVTALLTQDAVTPYGGTDRRMPADVEMEWWTGFLRMDEQVVMGLHPYVILCFMWMYEILLIAGRAVASSHIWDLLQPVSQRAAWKSPPRFWLFYSHFSPCSWRLMFASAWLMKLFLRIRVIITNQNSQATWKEKLAGIEGRTDRQMDVWRVGTKRKVVGLLLYVFCLTQGDGEIQEEDSERDRWTEDRRRRSILQRRGPRAECTQSQTHQRRDNNKRFCWILRLLK